MQFRLSKILFIRKLSSFSLVLVLLSSVYLNVYGIADRAAYYIQNVNDGLCITGGPVEDSTQPSIFKKGVVLTSNCSHDLKQQWVLKKTGLESYKLRSFNSKDMNRLLNAQVVGEFITYFPSPIELKTQYIKRNNTTQETRKDFYKLMLNDSLIKGCYTSMGQNHVLYLDQCDENVSSQLWNFSLVNEPPSGNCTSFWACNV